MNIKKIILPLLLILPNTLFCNNRQRLIRSLTHGPFKSSNNQIPIARLSKNACSKFSPLCNFNVWCECEDLRRIRKLSWNKFKENQSN